MIHKKVPMTHFDIFLSSLAIFAFGAFLSRASGISLEVTSSEFNAGTALFQNEENFDLESSLLSQVALHSTPYMELITVHKIIFILICNNLFRFPPPNSEFHRIVKIPWTCLHLAIHPLNPYL